MGYRLEKPRIESDTFYLAAKDKYGNYSEPNEFTINHPGIQQLVLEQQDVQGLIGSIKINLPTPLSETSQEVYVGGTTSEEKEILGYRFFIQEIDESGTAIGEEEIIDYSTEEVGKNGVFYYQAETGKNFEIQIGCYDSVYHPDYNPSLFEKTKSQIITVSTFKVERPDISEALIKPNDLTTTLQGTGLTVDDFGDGGIEPIYTLQAGVWDDTANEPIVGGIGLAYNSEENDIDVQIIADRFRLFDPDIEPNGTAIFAAGTVDGTSQIFMNANEITIAANDGNTDYTDGNFFVLDSEGLRINTNGLKLDKTGSAIFNGEVSSSQFSLNSGNLEINQDGINTNISSQFTLNSNDGSAEFGGTLSAATGTFEGFLSAQSNQVRLIETNYSGAIKLKYSNTEESQLMFMGSREISENIGDINIGVGSFELYQENFPTVPIINLVGETTGVMDAEGGSGAIYIRSVYGNDDIKLASGGLSSGGEVYVYDSQGRENVKILAFDTFTRLSINKLPTSDPTNQGQVWNDSGTLKISAG